MKVDISLTNTSAACLPVEDQIATERTKVGRAERAEHKEVNNQLDCDHARLHDIGIETSPAGTTMIRSKKKDKSSTRLAAVSFCYDDNKLESSTVNGARRKLMNLSVQVRDITAKATTDVMHEEKIDNSLSSRTPTSPTKDSLVDELWQFVRDVTTQRLNMDENNTEMTTQDKKALYRAVQSGDIDLVDEMLLLLPAADINMTWFSENLLMAAIRAEQSDMALFLLDNGIDCNYVTTRIDVTSPRMRISRYPVRCRQMAYDRGMMQVVDVIDELNGEAWPTMTTFRGPSREKRFRKIVSQLVPLIGELDENGKQVDPVDAQSSMTSPTDVVTTVSTRRKMTSRVSQMEQVQDKKALADGGQLRTFERHDVQCPGKLDCHHCRHHHVVVAPTTSNDRSITLVTTPAMTSARDSSRDVESRRSETQRVRSPSVHWSGRNHVADVHNNQHTDWREKYIREQNIYIKPTGHMIRATSAMANHVDERRSRDSRQNEVKYTKRALSARENTHNALHRSTSNATSAYLTGSRDISRCGSSYDVFLDADAEVRSDVVAVGRTVRIFSPWKEDDPQRLFQLERRAMKRDVGDGMSTTGCRRRAVGDGMSATGCRRRDVDVNKRRWSNNSNLSSVIVVGASTCNGDVSSECLRHDIKVQL